MSALTLDVRWSRQGNCEFPAAVTSNPATVSSWIGGGLHRCPACNSIVYSRRHSRCGVCEEFLPESLLFTNYEAEKVGHHENSVLDEF